MNQATEQPNLIDRIKKAIDATPGADFSKIIEQRAKTTVNVNSANPVKVRALMAQPAFAQACQANVTPQRKTIANGISLLVEDPEYGKPVIIRIRKGGLLARGVGNEAALVTIIDNAIQSGATSVIFEDGVGGKVIVNDMVSVRHVGNEAGSRTGNRADIEILDAAGEAHRVSVKNDNFSAIAKLKKFFSKRRLKIQKSLRDFAMAKKMGIPRKGLVSVLVKNKTLFNYCWFGNDIDENGGVVEGDFEKTPSVSVDEAKNAVIIKCTRAFSPKDNVNKLMADKTTRAWLIVKVTNKLWHMEVIGVYNDAMGHHYALPGFEIDEVTNERIMENLEMRIITYGQLKRLIAESARDLFRKQIEQ